MNAPAANSIAIMQPYFFPYAGYFRLFQRAELFVIFDCVQFPRRGWVHRNKLQKGDGTEDWLTLPLRKSPQNIKISALQFEPFAAQQMRERLRPYPLPARDLAFREEVILRLLRMDGSVADYLSDTMEFVVRHLQMPWNVIRSSSLNLPDDIRGQYRILEVMKRLGAKHYINSPGGIDLYDPVLFAENGVELEILRSYPGPYTSMLSRILTEDATAIYSEIAGADHFLQA